MTEYYLQRSQDEDRTVCLLWLQDLPRPWAHPGQGGRQDLQVLVWQDPEGARSEEESQEDQLDRPLQVSYLIIIVIIIIGTVFLLKLVDFLWQ